MDSPQPTNAQLMAELKKQQNDLKTTKRALAELLDAMGSDVGRHVSVGNSWLRRHIKNLESNPDTQYRVHLVASYYWLINFPIVVVLFCFAPHIWVAIGLLLNTLYSLWANFATDYGAMSAALAAKGFRPVSSADSPKEDQP